MPTIAVLCAFVFAAFALSMVLPLLAAIGEGDGRAFEAMLLVMVAYGFLSTVLTMALRSRGRELNRAEVFTGAIALWVSLILAATPVFMLVERRGFTEALFEAASAAVTLGSTLQPINDMSSAMAFYRGTTAWVGGLLTLLLAVYVVGLFQVGGTSNRHLRFIQHSQKERGLRILRTFRDVFIPYVTFTGACTIALIVFRIPAPDALIVAMSTLSTNGFVPLQTGASVLNNIAAETVMLIFMVIGATSILWHRLLLGRRWSLVVEQNECNRFLVFALSLLGVVMVASLFMPHDLQSAPRRAFNFAFDVVSVMTTTGITHDQRVGLGLPFELVLLIALIGGCSYSTAGGIKFFRLTAMLHHLGNELAHLVHPNAMLRDSVEFDDNERAFAKAVWSAFFIAILTITVAVLLFAAQGIELPDALGLATGSFSQVGNIVSGSLPESPSRATLLTITVLAVAARIEILVVLAAFSSNRW